MFPTIEMLMSKKIHSIDAHLTVREAAEAMTRNAIGSLLVSQEGVYIGIITEVDIIRKVVAKGEDPNHVSIKTVMSFPLITIDAGRPVVEANDLMEQKRVRHLGVTKNGKIIGMVSIRDFLRPLDMEQVIGF